MKSIILLLLWAMSIPLVYAQTQSVENLKEEAQNVKAKKGERHVLYCTKLLEVVDALQQEKGYEEARTLLYETGETLVKIQELLGDPDSSKTLIDLEIQQEKFAGFRSDYELAWWKQLALEEKVTIGQDFLKQNKWFQLSAVAGEHENILKLIELSDEYYGTESAIYLTNWERAYNTYNAFETRDREQAEVLWKMLLKSRSKSQGKSSNVYLAAVFGYSNFCKRIGKTATYKKLKAEVEAHWSMAYDGMPEATKENIEKGDIPPPPPPADSDETESSDTWTSVDQMPRFPGCEDHAEEDLEKKKCADQRLLQFIYSHVKYPKIAIENGIEGMSVVSFVVTEYGTIRDIAILRNPGGATGEEALRVVELMNELPTRWTPGRQDGKDVRVKYNLPVRFKLN